MGSRLVCLSKVEATFAPDRATIRNKGAVLSIGGDVAVGLSEFLAW